MSAAELIEWAGAEGVALSVRGDRLSIKADRPPSAALVDELRSHKREVVDTLTARYRDTLSRSAGVPFDWLAVHYFWPQDLAAIDAGRYPDPVALGELIRTDPAYPFGWCETTPVAAPAVADNDAPADPLAELMAQGLELAGDDRAFIRQHLTGSPDHRRTTLAAYARHWLAAMEGKPEHQRQNAGRFAANTWLRNPTP